MLQNSNFCGTAQRAGRACGRRPCTAGLPRASLSRSTTRSESRSSSCAQTAEAHADGDHRRPARRPVRSAPRRPSPAASRPGPLHLREQRRGHASAAVTRVERDGQRARARAALHAASWSTAPSAIASRATPASSPPGTCARSVVVIRLCPLRAEDLDQPAAAAGVELGHDVVEEHQRRRAAGLGERLALGEQQREQPEPLLAARAVGAQLAAVAAQDQVVAVRPVAR